MASKKVKKVNYEKFGWDEVELVEILRPAKSKAKALLTKVKRLIAYDPDQERDESGRWTDEGGGGSGGDKDKGSGGGGKSEPAIAPVGAGDGGLAQDLLEKNHDPNVTLDDVLENFSADEIQKIRDQEKEIATSGVPTNAPVEQGGFKNADGTYTEERQALHEKIIEGIFNEQAVRDATPADGEQPVYIMTGGRPGAGKTTSLNAGGIDLDSKFILVSADDAMASLPGYKPGLSSLYTFEGQDIAAQVERIARESKLNIVYDATMKTTSSAVKRVEDFKASGYKVEVYFTHTSPETSAKRSLERFLGGGRFVLPELSLSSKTNEGSFAAVSKMADKWALFDNNGIKPKRVARGGQW